MRIIADYETVEIRKHNKNNNLADFEKLHCIQCMVQHLWEKLLQKAYNQPEKNIVSYWKNNLTTTHFSTT